jgi:hypothetical protein
MAEFPFLNQTEDTVARVAATNLCRGRADTL